MYVFGGRWSGGKGVLVAQGFGFSGKSLKFNKQVCLF